jgi:hypothetical protein
LINPASPGKGERRLSGSNLLSRSMLGSQGYINYLSLLSSS